MIPFIFLVNDEPYSLWDPDIHDRTMQFLDSIDPGYFGFLAESHAEQLDSEEHKRRVATATRIAYLHGVETLMTLLSAAVQAPQAPYAWVTLAKTDLLRAVVERISIGDTSLHSELANWDRTWRGLAQLVFSNLGERDGWGTSTAQSIGRIWAIFAADFLDDKNQMEYNGLKHGFRIRSSGAFISIGKEHEYGVSPPREEMKLIGGSDTGSTFFAIERAGPDVPGNRSRRTRRVTVNWQPEPMIRSLQLIGMSIQNVVSFLRIVNGAPGNTAKFERPEGIEDYEGFVRQTVGVRSMNFDRIIVDSSVEVTTKEQLLEQLKQDIDDSDKS